MYLFSLNYHSWRSRHFAFTIGESMRKALLLASCLAVSLWVYTQSNPTTTSNVVAVKTHEAYVIEIAAAADLAAKLAVDTAGESVNTIGDTHGNCATCKVAKWRLSRDSPVDEVFPSM